MKKIKTIIKQNKYFLLTIIAVLLINLIELPFYINTPGGLINVEKKIDITSNYDTAGSFNLAYVGELKATLPTLIYSLFDKNYDIIKTSDVVESNETIQDASYRSSMLMKEATTNALLVAFNALNINVSIDSQKMYITYIDTKAETNLKIKDEILKIDNRSVFKKEDIEELISKKNINDEVMITVKENNKIIEKTAKIIDYSGKKVLGIIISYDREVTTVPKVAFKFKSNETGPSGGLMMSLYIYNSQIEEDLTKGKKIVGTGTIDINGQVGSIGGVKYKLKGAVKKKADIFLVPSGENYEEAIKLKEKHHYKIDIVPIATFDEAITFLRQLK